MSTALFVSTFLRPSTGWAPVPIPGMESITGEIGGNLVWAGLVIASLSVVAGLAGVAGTVFLGWHMSKKLVAGIIIALICGALIMGAGAITGRFFPGV